jgi:hypothetical protein
LYPTEERLSVLSSAPELPCEQSLFAEWREIFGSCFATHDSALPPCIYLVRRPASPRQQSSYVIAPTRQANLANDLGKSRIGAQWVKARFVVQPYHANGADLSRVVEPFESGILVA